MTDDERATIARVKECLGHPGQDKKSWWTINGTKLVALAEHLAQTEELLADLLNPGSDSAVSQAYERGRMDEREACAELMESQRISANGFGDLTGICLYAEKHAAAIRARGRK